MIRSPARRRGGVGVGAIALFAALVVALAVVGRAAVTLSAESTLATSATTPDVQFADGNATSNSRYFKDFTVSPDKASFRGDLKAKGGADMTVKDVVRLTNVGGASRTVTFTSTQVTNAYYEVFAWTVKDGDATIATFDYTAAAPTASFALPAAATYKLDLRVDLADGAGDDNARVPFGLQVEVR